MQLTYLSKDLLQHSSRKDVNNIKNPLFLCLSYFLPCTRHECPAAHRSMPCSKSCEVRRFTNVPTTSMKCIYSRISIVRICSLAISYVSELKFASAVIATTVIKDACAYVVIHIGTFVTECFSVFAVSYNFADTATIIEATTVLQGVSPNPYGKYAAMPWIKITTACHSKGIQVNENYTPSYWLNTGNVCTQSSKMVAICIFKLQFQIQT